MCITPTPWRARPRDRVRDARARPIGCYPTALTSGSGVATAYQWAGRVDDAIVIFEPLLADSERILGAEHPDTLTTRSNLAVAYDSTGRANDARRLRRAD